MSKKLANRKDIRKMVQVNLSGKKNQLLTVYYTIGFIIL